MNGGGIETECPAVNGAGHKCCWEADHDHDENLPEFDKELDPRLTLNGVKVHGYDVPNVPDWEVWTIRSDN